MTIIRYAILFVVLFMIFSCSGKVKTEAEYYKWLENPKNHLCISKKVNGFKLKMKYLPPELLAYNEYQNTLSEGTKLNKDSLLASYRDVRTFLFTISDVADNVKHDVLDYKVYSEQEFKQRFMDINFDLGDYLWIESGSQKYKPILSTMESSYNLNNSRSFYVVFGNNSKKPDLLKADHICIVFNDLFFETGISRFDFYKKDMDNTPSLKFGKNY